MPASSSDDHPRVDQVAVDLLDPGAGSPGVARGYCGATEKKKRVAEGRAEGQHDREDVEEEADACSRVAIVASIGGKHTPLAATEQQSAAQSPSRRRSASIEAGRREGRRDLVELGGSRPEQTRVGDRGRSPEQQRGGSGALPRSPTSCAATARRTGAVRLATVVGASGGQPLAQVDALELELDAVGGGVRGCRLDRGGLVVVAATGSQPSLAAAIASTPEPVPRSVSGPVGLAGLGQLQQQLEAEPGGRVGAGAEGAGRGRRRGRSRPRAAPPRRGAARAARRPGAACGSPASGRPSRRGPRSRLTSTRPSPAAASISPSSGSSPSPP